MAIAELISKTEVLLPEESIRNPSIHLVNTRTFLHEQSEKAGRPLRLIDVPDSVWIDISQNQKHSAIWFMGIYEESPMGKLSALNYQDQYREVLQDLILEDVVASPFAIKSYQPDPRIAADWEEWDAFYHKLRDCFNLSIILDFVPNHVALDHPWTQSHPEYFINHSSHNPDQTPDGFFKVTAPDGSVNYFAHGKDPNFPPWFDTLQLNYDNADLNEAMVQELLSLVPHCDGVRCDMAMLDTDQTFYSTWRGIITDPWIVDFWPGAISRAHQRARELLKGFIFLAEAYWDKDRLVQEGFDGLYQKDLYNLMEQNDVHNIRNTLRYISTSQYKHVVFLENHDEKRAVTMFGKDRLKAYMALLSFSPNTILLMHQGQTEGMTKKVPMQVNRFPNEDTDVELSSFYKTLLSYRQQDIFIQGEYSIPDIHQYDENTIVSQQLTCNTHVVSMHTNLSANKANACVPIPKNVKNLSILSFNQWEYVSEEKIAEIYDKGLFIQLSPWETQAIEYTIV